MRIVEILFYDQNKAKLVVEMPDPSRCTTDTVPHLPRDLHHTGDGLLDEQRRVGDRKRLVRE